MPDFDPLADLEPAAYAPFRDPRDYILSWTDQIWIDKGLGRLGEHYADDIKVHTAYGETYDFEHVLLNSVQKMSRSEEHTSELQSLMRISYTVFFFKKKTTHLAPK